MEIILSYQRAFNATPRQRIADVGKATAMPTAWAKTTTGCPLCPVRVKSGQRVALHFASGEWAHVGCVVRLINCAAPMIS